MDKLSVDKEKYTGVSRTEQLSVVQKEALKLFGEKNQDDGDAFAKYGPVGVIVRYPDFRRFQRMESI